MNYADSSAGERFLEKSKYYPGPIDREQLLMSFREKQPELLKPEPFENGDTMVDASLKEITLLFSKPMDKTYSINFGNGGREHYPITNVVGYSEDKIRIALNINLQPGHQYEFIVSEAFYQYRSQGILAVFEVYFIFWNKWDSVLI